MVRVDGSVSYAEAHTSPLWKDGEIVGALVFLHDITERKREHELMAQSDKLRAVGELAAGVAHNLNNSLTVIQGRAQLLLRNAADESSAKSLQIITNAVEDGTKTLRRILNSPAAIPAVNLRRLSWATSLPRASTLPGRSGRASPGRARSK